MLEYYISIQAIHTRDQPHYHPPHQAYLKFVATVTTGGRINFSSCAKFSRKQRVSLQNLQRNMKFTHLFGKFAHTFSPKLL